MVILFTFELEQLAVLFQGDCYVVDGLLVAFVVQIGLAQMAMRCNQSELRFPMRKHQDLNGKPFTFARAS